MSDQKPLRQEDYAAMAEELRRAKEENDRLRGSRWTAAEIRDAFVTTGKLLAFAAAGTLLICFVAWLIHDDPKARHTPCFFVRHAVDEEYERGMMPWDPWLVIRSTKSGGSNYAVVKDHNYVTFSTQSEAWSFIQKWNLPACQ